MGYKWIGAALIILSCGGFGFSLAVSHKKEENTLRQLISALDFMECELQYRLTPLPDLCRQAGTQLSGMMHDVFLSLADELECQISPDVSSCMRSALSGREELPKHTRSCLMQLGNSLGRFDLAGQIKGLDAVRAECRRTLEDLSANREVRLRSYQTLGLCAGAALAILFV